ncbi:MAG: hypothetical protein ABIJ36_01985 [Patescibacteria group bacterium]|nr:hypothetical protein [Patescibacteria group bacterium]
MQQTRSVKFYLLISSFFILVLSCVFSVVGLVIAYFSFKFVFGKPYEMGWLFLTFIGQISALVFGFISSVVSSLLSVVFIKKDYKKRKVVNGVSPWLIVAGAYVLFLVWLIILAAMISKATPPCPNCYK